MAENVEITVTDHPERSRYEAHDRSGGIAGFASYEKTGGLIAFTHTEVDDAFEGQGVGSTLTRAALDDVRTTGLQVRALCPFVSAYIDRHPEYADLLD